MTVRTPPDATAIAFAQRRYERPAPYRWWQRLLDHRQGRRDGKSLSVSQSVDVEAGQTPPLVLLTPWVLRHIDRTNQAHAHELITLQRIVDALEVELATDAASAITEPPAEHSGKPRTVGEEFETAKEREARRAREQAARQARRDALAQRQRELQGQIASARATYAQRVAALRSAAAQRVATYTRGMQRTAPSAALVHHLSSGQALPWGPVIAPPAG